VKSSSRKFAVPLLDYFDTIRWTVRGGSRRTPGAAAMTLDAAGCCTVKSAAEVAAKAPKVGLTADASLNVQSSGALNLKGGVVSIKGDMRAEFDSPSTTVGSMMTTVCGQIVSISGSLVKLG